MRGEKGFTLVELLVALAITGIISTAMGSVYIRNLHVYTDQTAAVHVQQTLRATLNYLVRQTRMAGYAGTNSDGDPDPTNANDADNAGIDTATEGRLQLSADFDNSGNLTDSGGENIDIKLRDDADGDGVIDDALNDNSGSNLTIQFNNQGGYQTVAEHIAAISFTYAIQPTTAGANTTLWAIPDPNGGPNWMSLDANNDGHISSADDLNNDNSIDLTNTGIPIDTDDNGTIDTADFSIIRAVKLTLLGVTDQPSSRSSTAATYVVGRHILKTKDNLLRRLVSTSVTCRNMGL
jgi:type IV pilus assembly protein PilW